MDIPLAFFFQGGGGWEGGWMGTYMYFLLIPWVINLKFKLLLGSSSYVIWPERGTINDMFGSVLI